jgi:hypothetical protein
MRFEKATQMRRAKKMAFIVDYLFLYYKRDGAKYL